MLVTIIFSLFYNVFSLKFISCVLILSIWTSLKYCLVKTYSVLAVRMLNLLQVDKICQNRYRICLELTVEINFFKQAFKNVIQRAFGKFTNIFLEEFNKILSQKSTNVRFFLSHNCIQRIKSKKIRV